MYRTPGEYVGMYTGADAKFRSEERGGIDRFDLMLPLILTTVSILD